MAPNSVYGWTSGHSYIPRSQQRTARDVPRHIVQEIRWGRTTVLHAENHGDFVDLTYDIVEGDIDPVRAAQMRYENAQAMRVVSPTRILMDEYATLSAGEDRTTLGIDLAYRKSGDSVPLHSVSATTTNKAPSKQDTKFQESLRKVKLHRLGQQRRIENKV